MTEKQGVSAGKLAGVIMRNGERLVACVHVAAGARGRVAEIAPDGKKMFLCGECELKDEDAQLDVVECFFAKGIEG